MKLKSKTTGDVTTIYMESGGGGYLLGKMETVVQVGIRGVVVSMEKIEKVRSDDLEYMIKARCLMERNSGYFAICQVGDRLYRALGKVGLESFFLIFRTEDAATQYIQEQVDENGGEIESEEEIDQPEKQAIRNLKKSTRRISVRRKKSTTTIRVPEMTIKIFVKKTITDLFYIDLLNWFLGREGAVLSGKDIAREFGIDEGVIKTAMEDMAASGVIERTSSGLFGKPTYCLNASEEQVTCIEDLKSMMKSPGGKGRIIAWIKEGS